MKLEELFEEVLSESQIKVIGTGHLWQPDSQTHNIYNWVAIKDRGYYLIKVTLELDEDFMPIPGSEAICKSCVCKVRKSMIEDTLRWGDEPKTYKEAEFKDEWESLILEADSPVLESFKPNRRTFSYSGDFGFGDRGYSSPSIDDDSGFFFGTPMGHNFMNMF